MSAQLHWPYDEVSLELSPSLDRVAIVAPWLRAEVGVPPEAASALQNLSAKLRSQTLAAVDLGLVNWFFSPLDAYPFCYTLPSPKEGMELDTHTVTPPALPLDSVEVCLGAALTGGPTESLGQCLSGLARKHWAWDWEAASAFANLGGKIHPESFFSVARRFHLLDVLEINDGGKVFAQISALDGDAFRKAAGLLVRQNHFVTQRCREALLPALAIAGRARPAVEHFLKEEHGHDRILEIALRSFTDDAKSIPVAA